MKTPALLIASVLAFALPQGVFGVYSCVGEATANGRCGPSFNNARCMRPGDYCSSFGWCGSTDAHKNTDQCGGEPSPGFYTCTGAPRPDKRCGPAFGNAACAKDLDYCSINGLCGTTSAHKKSHQCGGPSPGESAAPGYKCVGLATMTGQCGPSHNNARCMRPGDFCSSSGWCGSSAAHKNTDQCGGASPGFYKCTNGYRGDNRCGKDYDNAGCAQAFDHCSMFGWCGNTTAHKQSDQCGGPSPGSSFSCLGEPTMTGQCGPGFNNARCQRAGDYCSAFGWCGSSPDHKRNDKCNGPSPGFYKCVGEHRADNRCGKDWNNAGCAKPFDFCSKFGWCGNTEEHKASDQCGGPSPGSPSFASTTYKCLGEPTMTGQCGPNFKHARCQRAGDFCSSHGWCGSTPLHKSLDQCGGPSPGFYTCKGAARADNRCGKDWGNAGCALAFDFCSKFGWCGNTTEHKISDQCGGPSPGGPNPGM